MDAMRDSEGLQVDRETLNAIKAPEVVGGGQHHQHQDQHQHQHQHGGYYTPAPQQQRVPLGLSLRSFGLLIAAATAIVIGGGVGGGLGAALANCHNSESSEKSDSSTPNSTSTSDSAIYTPMPNEDIKQVAWDCVEKEETKEYTTSNGYKFKVYCGLDAFAPSKAEGGGTMKDIAPIIAFSLEDCLYACGEMTNRNKTEDTGVVCKSVTFRPGLAHSLKNYGANCWLKDGKKQRGPTWVYDDAVAVAYGEVLDN